MQEGNKKTTSSGEKICGNCGQASFGEIIFSGKRRNSIIKTDYCSLCGLPVDRQKRGF